MASVDTTAAQSTNGHQSGADIPVENPATGEVIAYVADLDADAVADLARRGRAAQPAWQALGYDARARVLLRMRRWLMDNADRVVATIVSETGKTYEDGYVVELLYTGGAIGYWAKHGKRFLADERVAVATLAVAGKKLLTRYEPLGLVGVIGPWNYPMVNTFGDAIPALLAGNSVILKPSEITPLTSLLLAEGLEASGLPAHVLQVATGRGETGAALVDEADMMMFTGSTQTGKRVLARAAQTLTPVSLELGGKDPMIVLADADLERAANAAVFYSMLNGGQTCVSVERVYVEEPVYEDFLGRVVEKVSAIRQGASTGPATAEVGAMTTAAQLQIVEAHVADAVAKGARALTGGRRAPGKGHFYEPTVLVDVDHTMQAMTEETFGPTLPIMRVADAEEAVRLANDSPYGLAASIYTDGARGEQLARRLQAGAVCVNDALMNYMAAELPMGGWKASGLGTRHGAGGIRKYTKQQSLLISRLNLKREPWMFPYRSEHLEAAVPRHAADLRPRQARLTPASRPAPAPHRQPDGRDRARAGLLAAVGDLGLHGRPQEPHVRGDDRARRDVPDVADGDGDLRRRAGAGPPGSEAILAGLGAGLFGIAGLTAFYRALAIGTMSIVAPIAATGVSLPVLVGLATGDQPGLLRSIGLLAAVAGVVLASRERSEGERARACSARASCWRSSRGWASGPTSRSPRSPRRATSAGRCCSRGSPRRRSSPCSPCSRCAAARAAARSRPARDRGDRPDRPRRQRALQRGDDDRRAVDGRGRELAVPRDHGPARRGAARRARARVQRTGVVVALCGVVLIAAGA